MADYPNDEPDDLTAPSDDSLAASRDTLLTERRRLVVALGGSGAVVLAGCLGMNDDEDEAVDSFEIVFRDQDQTVSVDSDQDILAAALDAGVDIPYSCEVGRCGQCTAKYDGDAGTVVTHDGNEYLEENEIEAGWVLTCVAYPDDDFELEVAHPDDG